MKKLLIILFVLVLMIGSVAYAEDVPDNFIVIGNKVIELSYAFNNKLEFNTILMDHIQQDGSLNDIYMSIGGALSDIYGNIKTESERQEIILSCTTIIDNDSPNGRPIGSEIEGFRVISIY